MIQGEQKKISDSVLKICCLAIAQMGLGIMTMPMFFPLMSKEINFLGSTVGFILALPSLSTIVASPFMLSFI